MGIVESTYAELKQQELKNNPYSCLHMADIDINPHQVEAFTFALSSLELGGAILADEVGLGKTIEAGLVIKYLLCSGKNKILLIMPSNLRKQWQVELEEKFDIDSLIVDSSNWEDYLAKVKSKQAVIIVSYHFASKRKTEFGKIAWDFCVFDEAHRLRNVYKNGSKMANSLYELTKGIPKILLTATPMQNTLFDIYGLVQFIDDRVFYSKQIFSERYLRGEDYNDLKACLEPVVQRTLRKEVAEYIQFSERKEMTIDFELSPMEIELYVMINNYLKKEILYALPNSHRTLITSKDDLSKLNAVDYSSEIGGGLAIERVAVVQQGNWIGPELSGIDEEVANKMGILPIPLKGVKEDCIPTGISIYWCINSQSGDKEKEASKEFLKWLFQSDEGKQIVVNDFGFVPAFNNYDDVEITDTLSKEVKRYIDEGKTLPWVMGGFPSGYEPKAAADFQGYFSGEYTFDQMVDQLKADFVELKK